jgi:hypothetical protein
MLRDLRKKLLMNPSMTNGTLSEPVPVTKAKLLFRSCLDLPTANKLQFSPLLRFLKDYKLPRVPTLIKDSEQTGAEFDWIKSIVKIKKSLGVDKIIGLEVCKYLKIKLWAALIV